MDSILQFFYQFSWWQYAIAVFFIICTVIYYYVQKGYKRIQMRPIPGIPVPPLSHPLLGHPEQMYYPGRHELRLDTCNRIASGIHQLLFASQSTVFINDAKEAGRILSEVKSKGPLYAGYRLHPKIPDILASEGDAHAKRKEYLASSIKAMELCNAATMNFDLLFTLKNHSENETELDIKELFSLYALDVICQTAFDYKLNAVSGSIEGKKLLSTFNTIQRASAGDNKVLKSELAQAKEFWNQFLLKISTQMISQAEEYLKTNPALLRETKFSHALVQLIKDFPSSFNNEVMMAEIYQILRHGHESIATSLCWLVYSLYKVKKLRLKLEHALLESTHTHDTKSCPPYVNCIIKELLRRYPPNGNMTVRTISEENCSPFSIGGENPSEEMKPGMIALNEYSIPVGTTVHVHIFSLQNTTREWDKPQEFAPERWLQDEVKITNDGQVEGEMNNFKGPRCPFMKSLNKEPIDVFDGAGRSSGSLCYLPFSAGERMCLGKNLALEVLQVFLRDVCRLYRFVPFHPFWMDDYGQSLVTTIAPSITKATIVKVIKVNELGSEADIDASMIDLLEDDEIVKEDIMKDDMMDNDEDVVEEEANHEEEEEAGSKQQMEETK